MFFEHIHPNFSSLPTFLWTRAEHRLEEQQWSGSVGHNSTLPCYWHHDGWEGRAANNHWRCYQKYNGSYCLPALYLMSVRPVWHPAGKRIYTAIVLRCSGGPKGDNMTKLSATKVFGGHTFLWRCGVSTAGKSSLVRTDRMCWQWWWWDLDMHITKPMCSEQKSTSQMLPLVYIFLCFAVCKLALENKPKEISQISVPLYWKEQRSRCGRGEAQSSFC